MKTLIKVDEKYKIIKKKTTNKKPLPNKLLDLIIPIFSKEVKK